MGLAGRAASAEGKAGKPAWDARFPQESEGRKAGKRFVDLNAKLTPLGRAGVCLAQHHGCGEASGDKMLGGNCMTNTPPPS